MFEHVVVILLPVFMVVGLGYVSARTGFVGDGSARILSRFVTHVSLPALLFGVLASERFENIFNLPFLAAFGSAALVCFVLPWILMPGGRTGLGQRAMRGMGASMASVTFSGIPVLTPLLGAAALPAVGLANIVVTSIMAAGIVMLELERSGRGDLLSALRTALLHAFANPMIVGTVAGIAYSLGGLGLPAWVLSTTHMLGAATPPVALFALGAALVSTRLGGLRELGFVTVIKLVVMPLVTLGVLLCFPGVEPQWAVAAVVLAAMATAVREYMIAEQFQEYVEQASGIVLLTTLLSAVTLPAFIMWSLHIWPPG